jgi:parallel beta-helix repeat protein
MIRSAARRRVVVVLVALLAASACRPVLQDTGITRLAGDVDESSQLIGCDRAAERVNVTVTSHLDPSCTYTGGFDVTASNVVFDCRGARIETTTGDGRGIGVRSPATVAQANVVVRNCVVKGFLNNIRVTRTGFKDLAPGSEYADASSNIVIENSHLYESRGSGLFVDGFVTDVTLRNLEIAGSGGVGIYLEAGSKDNVVESNHIHNNGFGDVVPEGVPFDFFGVQFRYASTGREGIAIDGSRNNVVRNNRISANSAGGIFLYKNCGEYATERPNQWWERLYGANGNLIEDNLISYEENGVWVGSRMAENQLFMDCSDPTYAADALRAIHRDVALDNTIRGNTLFKAGLGVRVEDDGTVVEDNVFLSDVATDQAVLVGTKERTAILGEPVSGTVIDGNVSLITGNHEPYRWIHGHVGTVYGENLDALTPAPLVPGTQPTINPFLFVEYFWAA